MVLVTNHVANVAWLVKQTQNMHQDVASRNQVGLTCLKTALINYRAIYTQGLANLIRDEYNMANTALLASTKQKSIPMLYVTN